MKRYFVLFGILGILGVMGLTACRGGKEKGGETTASADTTPATTEVETEPVTTEVETTVPETTTEVTTTEAVTTEPETTVDPFAGEGPYEIDGYTYYVDVRRYLPFICPAGDEEYLILANRDHPIGKEYVPTDLVAMNTNEEKECRMYANYACDAMVAEMKVLGVYDTFPQSTYRSYSLQYSLYNRYLAEERAAHPHYTEEQIIALVDSYSARPGTSDHQTGLAIDFYPVSEAFEKRKAYDYLLENAHKFGFILRFPEGKTDVTGYMFESWHWRFVGREAATYIHEHGITLEEYLEGRYGGTQP